MRKGGQDEKEEREGVSKKGRNLTWSSVAGGQAGIIVQKSPPVPPPKTTQPKNPPPTTQTTHPPPTQKYPAQRARPKTPTQTDPPRLLKSSPLSFKLKDHSLQVLISYKEKKHKGIMKRKREGTFLFKK